MMGKIRITVESLDGKGEVLEKRGVTIDAATDLDLSRNISVGLAKTAIELVLDPESKRWPLADYKVD